MGNASSADVSLGVKTEKVAYLAGETVKGNVYLLVNAPTSATGVFLRVKGAEHVWFTERRTGRDAEDKERTYQDEVSFFNVTMPLLTAQGGTLQPGQYQIPFTFTLPYSLPGVFKEEQGVNGSESYKCSIDFEVMAYIEVPGVFSSNIKHRQLLAVTAATDPKLIHSETIEKVKKVCFLCCIPRGEIWMRASLDQNAYRPGDIANVRLEMNNGSKAAIHHVTLRLVRRLRLGTRGNGWVFYKSDVLTSMEIPGLLPKEARMDMAARTLAFPLKSSEGQHVQAEVVGTLIECTYVIEIAAKIEWTPVVGIEIPVHIYHAASAPPQGFKHEELPNASEVTEWNPLMSESVDIPMATITTDGGGVGGVSGGSVGGGVPLAQASAPPAPYAGGKENIY